MNGLEELLFSPLGKEYCLLFYYSAIVAFVFLVLGVAGGVHQVMKKKMSVFALMIGLISPALLYLNNRLLYSMCIGMRK